MVAREELAAVLLGLAAGLTAAMACGRYVESQLFGVKGNDLPVFLLSAGVLLVAAFVAALIPARRAVRVDPMVALRYE